MSSESALPTVIPKVAWGINISACSLCCVWLGKEENSLAHFWWYLLEVTGFDLHLIFLFFTLLFLRDGAFITHSALAHFCAGLVPTLAERNLEAALNDADGNRYLRLMPAM